MEEEQVQAFLDAAEGGHRGVVEAMLNHDGNLVNTRGTDGETALMEASSNGHLEVVRLLLSNGADVNLVCMKGWTALTLADNYQHTNVMSLLLEHGADTGFKNSLGWTVLMLASANGHVAAVELLLQHEPTYLEEKEENGATALYLACACAGGPEVVRRLILAGADHTIADDDGITPRQAAENAHDDAVIEIFDWFEGELERGYCLAKARQVEDDREAIRLAATKVTTEEEAQRAREEAAPEHVRGRVVRGEALPSVEVVGGDGAEASSSGDRPDRGEEERAVLREVVGRMKEDCFIILREMMKPR